MTVISSINSVSSFLVYPSVSKKLFVSHLSLGNPCESSNYKDLNEGDRSVNYHDATDKCDHEDLANEFHFWYKVSGNAGNALAAVDVPQTDRCGTKVRLYLKQNHPTPSEGQVTRQVCSATKNNDCNQRVDIDVINCGAFYMYKLHDLRPNCSPNAWRYCTNGEAGK